MAATGEIRTTGNADGCAYWQSHIEAWKRSDQSKQAYYREHGLNRGSFQRWCGRLLKEKASQPPLLPVRLATVVAPRHAVEVTLRNRRVLRLGDDAEPTWIAQLVEALDRAV